MAYTVEVATIAARQLRKLDRQIQARIYSRLKKLEDDPRRQAPSNSKGLLQLSIGFVSVPSESSMSSRPTNSWCSWCGSHTAVKLIADLLHIPTNVDTDSDEGGHLRPVD